MKNQQHYKFCKIKSKFAFTLAEVLITLGIIGVVAAMTIPTLINNYQKQSTANRLKKAYSTLIQAYTLSQVENGSAANWTRAGNSKADNIKFMETYMFPYLQIIEKCLVDNVKCCSKDVKYLNGNLFSNDYYFSFVLVDGTSIISYSYDSYAILYVDVNGIKKPNIFGKDIFRFDLGFNGINYLEPVGYYQGTKYLTREEMLNGDSANPTYGCSKTDEGIYCAGLIAHDGWEIKDDYPW